MKKLIIIALTLIAPHYSLAQDGSPNGKAKSKTSAAQDLSDQSSTFRKVELEGTTDAQKTRKIKERHTTNKPTVPARQSTVKLPQGQDTRAEADELLDSRKQTNAKDQRKSKKIKKTDPKTDLKADLLKLSNSKHKLKDTSGEKDESKDENWILNLFYFMIGLLFIDVVYRRRESFFIVAILSRRSLTSGDQSAETDIKSGTSEEVSTDDSMVWNARFEEVRAKYAGEYCAHYLINLAKAADWNFAHQDIIYERFGEHLGLPTIPTDEIIRGESRVQALKHLLKWLEKRGAETYPDLGLFDNFHIMMKREGEQEARQKFDELKEELGC